MPRVRFQPLRISKRSWRNVWSSPDSQPDDRLAVEEKRIDAGDGFEDYDGDSSGSSRASSNSYGSEDAMLQPKSVVKPSANAYAPRRQCNRYFTIILGAILVVTVLVLTQLHYHSARDVASGLHKPEPKPPPWEEFPMLERYFGGLRSLVPAQRNQPEYPGNEEDVKEDVIDALHKAEHESQDDKIDHGRALTARAVQDSDVYHPNLTLAADTITPCYIDPEKNITVPVLRAYDGVVNGSPDSIVGNHDMMQGKEGICFDRFGKLGPYGFGYSRLSGGTGAGTDGEREGADVVWADAPKVDFSAIHWARLQASCAKVNGQLSLSNADGDVRDANEKETRDQTSGALTAVLLRTWSDYKYSIEDLLNLRALISEVSLATGGQYQVHFLVEVRDAESQIWSDEAAHKKMLEDVLPSEFRGMATLWSEQQMRLVYGGLEEDGQNVYGAEHSAFMSVQYFAHQHPEYSHFWNWQMNIRYTGHLGELITNINTWTKAQPRKELWERNARFYIPSEHGSWEDFKQMVRVQSEHGTSSKASIWSKAGGARHNEADPAAVAAAEKTVWGPRSPAPQDIDISHDVKPPRSHDKDKYEWGVDEDADLVTLSPIFDPDGTSLSSATDVTGYNTTSGYPPLRASLGRTVRLSRRLLEAMHHETAAMRHTMGSDLWPATVALHHGLKAVYAPLPVYVDRKWPTDYLAAVYNDGLNGASGGARTSVWGDSRQHNLHGLSWGTRDSFFADKLWRRWLGYRVDGKGGEQWETSDESEGRMCLPPMMLWPVQNVDLVIA